jgi:hypothetical protein
MTIYYDFENRYNAKTLTLKKMTLRQYLAKAPAVSLSYAEDDDEPRFIMPDMPEWLDAIARLRKAATEGEDMVAHNAAYDSRVCKYGWTEDHGPLDIGYPLKSWCSMEAAMAAWPNQPGGYGLDNLAKSLGLPGKIEIDLEHATREELRVYNCRDVVLCREIWKRACERISPQEFEIGQVCNRWRELVLRIDPARRDAALAAFNTLVDENSDAAIDLLGGPEAFGLTDEGKVKSVSPAKIKAAIQELWGLNLETITVKKLAPGVLAANPGAALALDKVSKTNKALSHLRRVSALAGVEEVDAELGWARAHTFRFSAPSVGRGINGHNLPKSDKTIAKPIRSMIRLPEDLAFVRGDAANVEYRINCWLTDCRYGIDLFTADPLADPYAEFGKAATSVLCDPDDPIRQIWKEAVLGLGFLMSPQTFASTLMKALARPGSKVTLKHIEDIVEKNHWHTHLDQRLRVYGKKLLLPLPVLQCAQEVHHLFHDVHPEFVRFADWLEKCVKHAASAVNPDMDSLFRLRGAPDRRKLDLFVDDGLEGRSLRVRCGLWTPTVCWRDLRVREVHPGEFALSSVQAGSKGARAITRNIVIENVVQSCARNALCSAKLELGRRGYPYIGSIHDELLMVVDRTKTSIQQARKDLLEVCGPGNKLGYDWAFLLKPAEIACSESMWSEKQTLEWWENPTLETLP